MKSVFSLITVFFLTIICGHSFAEQVEITNVFVPDTTILSEEVNSNFDTVKNAVNDNDTRIAALEQEVQSLKSIIENITSTVGNGSLELSNGQTISLTSINRILGVNYLYQLAGGYNYAHGGPVEVMGMMSSSKIILNVIPKYESRCGGGACKEPYVICGNIVYNSNNDEWTGSYVMHNTYSDSRSTGTWVLTGNLPFQ